MNRRSARTITLACGLAGVSVLALLACGSFSGSDSPSAGPSGDATPGAAVDDGAAPDASPAGDGGPTVPTYRGATDVLETTGSILAVPRPTKAVAGDLLVLFVSTFVADTKGPDVRITTDEPNDAGAPAFTNLQTLKHCENLQRRLSYATQVDDGKTGFLVHNADVDAGGFVSAIIVAVAGGSAVDSHASSNYDFSLDPTANYAPSVDIQAARALVLVGMSTRDGVTLDVGPDASVHRVGAAARLGVFQGAFPGGPTGQIGPLTGETQRCWGLTTVAIAGRQ